MQAKTTRQLRLILEELEPRLLPSDGYLRIVTYNMGADMTSEPSPRPGFNQVLEGIGEEVVQGHVRPADIVALQETTDNINTVDPIVASLNSYYHGSAVYARSPYQAIEYQNHATLGNGPNAVVYNTLTVTLLASVGIGSPDGPANGEYRQDVRYEFQMAGYTGNAGAFYMYVAHFKANTADDFYRNEEARIIRDDEATLPANARVLYVGNFYFDSSADAACKTLTANASPSGKVQGAGFDPLNRPGNWSQNGTFTDTMTQSAKDLLYRYDFELVTKNILDDLRGGLGYVKGSYHVFGNNSTSSAVDQFFKDLVQDGGAFIPASKLYPDLVSASAHFPVVADYTMVVSSLRLRFVHFPGR